MIKEIFKIIWNYKLVKKDFVFLVFFAFIVESLYVLYPQFAKRLIEIIENKLEISELYFTLIVFFFFSLSVLILSFISRVFFNKVDLILWTNIDQNYRKNIFEKNYKDIADIWTGKLLTRFTNWVNAEVDIFMATVSILISAIYRWIIVIIILAFYIPKLIIAVLIWILLLFGINFYLRNYIKKFNKKEQELWEIDWKNKALIIMENLIIRIFWKTKFELKKSKKLLDQIPYYGVKVDSANVAFYYFLEFLLRVLEIWVYFIIWGLILSEWNLEISYLIMITGYIWFLWWPLDKAISNINTINKSWEKYSKLKDFIESEVDIKNWKKKYEFKEGKIEVKNIKFWYWKTKNLYEDLSIDFLAWKKNALVWHSWGWKSTIVKILLRLYDYKSWKILIDWQKLKDLKIETFYNKIWYLPQEPWIFDWTLRDNLEYWFSEDYKKSKKEKEKIIWEVLKKSEISDMVKSLEKWLDTEIWEKWIKLSGWEKQRLAIARIFIKNPQIIILDEPTSALDSISEAKINKALDNLLKWKTSIIIAHRLQTVMYSDKIIVLENWIIEWEWTHKELMKKSKVYKQLVDLQNWSINE